MTKVCHMTSAHPVEDVRIFHKECVSLAKAGYEVYLVERGESYEKDGVHIVGVGDIPASRRKRMTEGAKKVYETAKALDADIYHFHDPELLPYGLKLKKAGKKVIFDSHEKYIEQIQNKPYLPAWCRSLIADAYGTYERSVLRKIDGLIFPCLKDGVNPFAGQCSHIAAVNNVPILAETYDHYVPDVEKEPRSICYVGGLTYNRGITHLVKAAAKADCTLYLGGPFDSAQYQQETLSLPEAAHTKYLGILNRPQVMQLLQKCQIGMATILNVGQYNQYDNLATKVYEYMALGIPSILSRSSYNEKVVAQYQFGICVDPSNVDEIAEAIRYLLGHPDEARRMGENGRRAVKEEFNWGVEEKKLLALYEDILKN